jgi:heat shock protein HslJ
LRACADDAVTAQEGTYLQALEQVRSFKLERGVLRLKDDAGKTLLILAQARPEAIRRGGWTVAAINTGDAIVSVLEGIRLTATFGANGRVSGNTGCNQYSATYTLEGFSLKIGPAVSTRRACSSEEANRQETAFLRALEGVNGFRITGDRLELYGPDGQTLVNLNSLSQ